MEKYLAQIDSLILSLCALEEEIDIIEATLKTCSDITRKSHEEDLNKCYAKYARKLELLNIICSFISEPV